MQSRITFIIPPPVCETRKGTYRFGNFREFHQVERFRDELAQAAGFSIPILEGTPDDAPPEGFVFIYEAWIELLPAELGPRTIVLDVDREHVWSGRLDHLSTERLQLAAAVELLRYFDWKCHKDAGIGIHGLETVAQKAGMEVGKFRSPGSAYGVLACKHCRSLAELLVHYLTVYEELGLHTRKPRA